MAKDPEWTCRHEGDKAANISCFTITYVSSQRINPAQTGSDGEACQTEQQLQPPLSCDRSDRLDRNTKDDGVTIAIKRGCEGELLPDLRLSTIEAVGMELSSPEGPITMIAIYSPTQCKDLDKIIEHRPQLHRRYNVYISILLLSKLA